jgi:hypothetical protein
MKKIILSTCIAGFMGVMIGATAVHIYYEKNPVYKPMYITKDKLEEIKTFKLLATAHSSTTYSNSKRSYEWIQQNPQTSDTLGGAVFQVKTEEIISNYFIEKDRDMLKNVITRLQEKFGV